MNITLKGEDGKAFDETSRPIAEVASNGRISFNSLSADVLSFTISPEFRNASDQDIPEEGQEISLFFDNVRQFVGTVQTVSVRGSADDFTLNIEVMGPWFFMENTALSDFIEGEVERPEFRCPKGDLRENLQRFLGRAITLGVPMQIGTIDELFEVPTITLRDGSLAFGLSELIRQVPDAIAWFDYSGESTPSFNLTRRKVGEEQTTIDLATDVVNFNLRGELSLLVKKVSVPYAKLATDGSDLLLNQESSVGDMGSLQIVPLSGPELLDYEPPEYSEPAPVLDPITTIPLLQTFFSTSILADRVKDIWPFFQRLDARYPSASITTLTLSRWSNTPPASVSGLYNGTVPKLRFSDGTVVDSDDDPYHCSDVPGFKVPSQLGTATPLVDAYIDGTFYLFARAVPNPSSDWLQARADLDAAATHKSVITGGDNAGDTYWFFEFGLDVVLFDGSYSDHVFTLPAGSLTTYDYEEPPADYAQNLRDAQSWLPYTGDITLSADFAPITRYSGQTLNLSGGLPKLASMGALIEGEEFDLETGEHILRAGLPQRFSGVTSATRIDTRPNDNIFAI